MTVMSQDDAASIQVDVFSLISLSLSLFTRNSRQQRLIFERIHDVNFVRTHGPCRLCGR